jgi:hypothetical protein
MASLTPSTNLVSTNTNGTGSGSGMEGQPSPPSSSTVTTENGAIATTQPLDLRTPAQLALAALPPRRSSQTDRSSTNFDASSSLLVPSSGVSVPSSSPKNDSKLDGTLRVNTASSIPQLKTPPPRAAFTRSPMALLPMPSSSTASTAGLTVNAYSQPSSPTHGSSGSHGPYTEGAAAAIRWPVAGSNGNDDHHLLSSTAPHLRSPAPRQSSRQTKGIEAVRY